MWDGRVYNVGGGNDVSVSLRELTELCVGGDRQTRPDRLGPRDRSVDLRIYVTDCRKAQTDFGWRPTRARTDRPRHPRWMDDNRETGEDILA